MKKVIKKLSIFSCALVGSLLIGCQSLNDNLHSVNEGLSHLTGNNIPEQSSTQRISITNIWHVTDTQALNWVSQTDSTWNDHGRLTNVNWYIYWSQQIHYKTAVSLKAYQYCHQLSWAVPVGANCETYFKAYAMTHSEEGQDFDAKINRDLSH